MNDNIALNRALAKLAAVSSERDRYIQAFNQLEVAVTHHRRDAGTIAFSDADERLWKARDKLLVDLTAKQVKLPLPPRALGGGRDARGFAAYSPARNIS